MRQYRQGYIGSAQRLAASEIRAVSGECPRALSGQGAQRLAASEIRAVLRWAYMPPYDRCSTPCGIRDPSRGRQDRRRKLHPQCSTPCGIRDPSRVSSGQYCAHSSSAQRLAASEIRAGTLGASLGRIPGCSTPCGIRDPSRPLPGGRGGVFGFVLNALRHQRSEQTRSRAF